MGKKKPGKPGSDKLGKEGKPLEADFDSSRFMRTADVYDSDYPPEVIALAESLETGLVNKEDQEKLLKKILPELPPVVQKNARTLPRAIQFLIREKESNQSTLDQLIAERGKIKDRYDELYSPLIKQVETQAGIFFGGFRINYHIQAEADIYLRRDVRRFTAKMEALTKKEEPKKGQKNAGKNGPKKPPFTKDSYKVSFDISKGEVVCTFKDPVAAVYASVILQHLENDEIKLASQRADKLSAVLKRKGIKDTQIEELQERVRARLEPLKMENRKDDDVARKLLIKNPEGLIAMYVERCREVKELHERVEEAEAEVGKAAEQQIFIITGLQERLNELAVLLMSGGIRFPIITEPEPADSAVKGKYRLNLSILGGIGTAIREIIKDKDQSGEDLAESKALRESDKDRYRAELDKIQKLFDEDVQRMHRHVEATERAMGHLRDERAVLEQVLRENTQYFGDVVDQNEALLGINSRLAEKLGKATGKGTAKYKHEVKEESEEIKAVMLMLKGEIGKLKSAIKEYAVLMAKQRGVEPLEIEHDFNYLRNESKEKIVHTGPKPPEAPETLESIISDHKLILTDFSAAVAEIEKALGRISKQYGGLIENLPEGYKLGEGESVLALRSKVFAYMGYVQKSDIAYKKALFEFNKKYGHVLKSYAGLDAGAQGSSRLARLDAAEPAKSDSELMIDEAISIELNEIFTMVVRGEGKVRGLKKINEVERGIGKIEKDYKEAYAREAVLRDLVDLIESEPDNKQQLRGFSDPRKFKFSTMAAVKKRLEYLNENPGDEKKVAELYLSPETADPKADYEELKRLTARKEDIKNAKPSLFDLVKELEPSVKAKKQSVEYAKKALTKIDKAKKFKPKVPRYKGELVAWAKEKFGFEGDYKTLRDMLYEVSRATNEAEEFALEYRRVRKERDAFFEGYSRQAIELMKNTSKEYFDLIRERQNYLLEVFGSAVGQEVKSLDDLKAIIGNVAEQRGAYLENNKQKEKRLASIREKREKEIQTVNEKSEGKRVDLAQKMMENLYRK